MELAKGVTNGGLGIHNYLLSWKIPFTEYWFLYILFFIFVVFYFFHCLAGKSQHESLGFLLISVVLYVVNPWSPHFWISQTLFKFLVFFVLGWYLFSTKDMTRVVGNRKCLWISLISFAAFVLVYLWQLRIGTHAKAVYYLFFLTSITGTWFCANLAALISTNCRTLKEALDFYGKYSMQVYCVHLLFLDGMRLFLTKFLIPHYPLLILIVSVVTAIIMTTVFIKVIERYPVLDKLCFGKAA